MYIVVNACKQLLISGGGQLLGNEDGVKIPLGSGLPVGNSYKCMVHGMGFMAWFMAYKFLKKIVIYSVFSCFN